MRRLELGLFLLFITVSLFKSAAKAEEVPEKTFKNEGPFNISAPIALEPLKNNEVPLTAVEGSRLSIFKSLSEPSSPMTGRQRLKFYLNSTFGINPILRTSAVAGINQARNNVPEWGQGTEGYSIRFASSFGRRIIRNTIHHGIGSLLHEDPRYYPSGRSDVWSRSLYAAGQTFITHNDTGDTCFAYSRMLGTVSSIYLSREWYPERNRTVSEYLTSTATSIGFDAAINIFREFWPDVKRWLSH
jgi:hypothetical protein